ncbi:MAG: HD domain-containing phosphohydrolase [Chloroflexota bacterium]
MSTSNQAVSPYERIVNTPRITFYLIILSSAASLLITIVYAIFQQRIDKGTISLIFLTTACIFLLWIHYKGYSKFSGIILYLLVSSVLTYNIANGHAIYDEGMLAYPLLIVFTGLLFGKRFVALGTGITVAQLGFVYALAVEGKVQPFHGSMPLSLEETITTLVILMATGLLIWVVTSIIERAAYKILQSETELEQAYDLTLEAWAQALELSGREVLGHGCRVMNLSVKLGKRLGIEGEAMDQLRRGALLHDIGKMGIPDKILLKPGPLTEDEWDIVKNHTILAKEIFKDIPYLESALEVVCCHHEQLDGNGYPYQNKNEDIPFAAKLFSVVDSWDMLRSDRPYSKAWSDDEAAAYLRSKAGVEFDQRIVETLIDMAAEDELSGEQQ